METSYNIADAFAGGSAPESKDDPYRWYLCVENRRSLGWHCMLTSKKDALYPFESTARTMAIPIRKYSPPFLDKYLLTAKLAPTVKIGQSTQS